MTQPLDAFSYREGVLHAGEIPVSEIADAVGTPTFVYSAEAIRENYRRIESAFAPLGAHLHYAVKASSNLHLLRLLREQGAGMDVVSGGELERAWLAGTDMKDIVFAGVGKTEAEQRGALEGRFSPLCEDAERLGGRDIENRGPVGLFNVESESELEVLARVAADLGPRPRRLPGQPRRRREDARVHDHRPRREQVRRLGARVPEIFGGLPRGRRSSWLACTSTSARRCAIRALRVGGRGARDLIDTLEAAGHEISVLDLGGGWPMSYTDGESPEIEAFAEA